MWILSLLFLWQACTIRLSSCFHPTYISHYSAAPICKLSRTSCYGHRKVFYLKASSSEAAATLTEATTWNLRLVLQNLPTSNGRKTDQIFVVRAQFIEDEGYEPPQGTLRLEAEDKDDKNDEELQPRQLSLAKSRWILSEDPEDRKDSLWIWGLFKEPLYPFLLLQMEVDEIQLPGDDKESIPPFKLFAKINHKRENGQVILTSGADLKIRKTETVKADPFGAATVDIFEDVSVGRLQIQPIKKN
ncbi:hypothetical protein IV203_011897 [Nitzschia inconspicua]|uniref:Uncharacterized protein n=1 Tax=Nitzschia inconspicua TaxID=303405 RepID=A0A9K3PJ86_9STRA|nr:hypothetical protein IV203_011897 [Nitzschia inconspicua]